MLAMVDSSLRHVVRARHALSKQGFQLFRCRSVIDAHVQALLQEIESASDGTPADTIYFGGGTPSLLEPDEMYAAHVLLIHHGRAICHAQNPKHDLCPVRDRCRFVNPKAP